MEENNDIKKISEEKNHLNLDKKIDYNGLIFDNIHGYIPINNIIRKIIDTPVFQRLRYIHQTGALFYVFPTANHSRFEHSLGTYYLANKFITRLKENQPELNITEKIIKIVSIAGLCHDIGHLFFSHLFDDLFLKRLESYNKLGKNVHHEERSKFLLEYMIKKYEIDITEDELLVIGDLIYPKKSNYDKWESEFKVGKWLFQIVSNPKNNIDVDKFDYIYRDNQAVGLKLNFEYERIIEQSIVINDDIHYPIKVKDDLYHMFFIRYRLHRQIYNHKTVKSIELLLVDALFKLEETENISSCINDPERMIQFTDSYLRNCNNKNVKEIINRIECRILPSLVFESISIGDIKLDEDTEKRINELEKENLIKTMKFKVGYISGKGKNPLNSILFYNSKNKNVIKIESLKNFSLLINNKHQENFFRIYCMNKELKSELKNYFN
jgi:HD superfamily phosphohydrolase